MKYSPLRHRYVTVEKEAEVTASVNGSVLVPDENTKIFLHWLTEKGKLAATYTLTFPTLVHDTVKLVNNSGKPVKVRVIDI